jgi:hypothetical protein
MEFFLAFRMFAGKEKEPEKIIQSIINSNSVYLNEDANEPFAPS